MNAPAVIIAEVGLAHDGSFATAVSYLDAIKDAGANVAKFQFHMPGEGSLDEPFRVKPPFDNTRAEYWTRTGFSVEQWKVLRQTCEDEYGLGFMTSTFCEDAVSWARVFGQKQWKVPSGQIVNHLMLEAMAARGEPVYISTGLCVQEELERAIAHFVGDTPVTLLHCVSAYPSDPKEWRLGNIERLARTYGLPVGLSDHSGTIVPALAATARYNVAAIEVHVTLSKRLKLPDTACSLTMDDLAALVSGVRAIEASRHGLPVFPRQFEEARRMYMPSLVSKEPLKKGTKVQLNHMIHRKVGKGPGLPWERVVGRVLKADVPENHVFAETDFTELCARSAS